MNTSALVHNFDSWILHSLNGFSQKSRLLDHAVGGFEGDPLLKGGVMAAFLWWAWFRGGDQSERDRAAIVAGTAAAIPSILAARLLAICLPFRQRPIYTPDLHFVPPYGSESASLIHWSSFPSDHASLYICLAVTLWFVSRRVGTAAFTYVSLFICLPRLYMGDHYPTDLVVGGLIGALFAILFQTRAIRDGLARIPNRLLEQFPGFFYSTAFFFSLMMATNFDTPRKVLGELAKTMKSHM
jgi:membrane-associated phospholipid phosphatase